MKSAKIPMTIEEFESMPHPFGWKVEYWDGKAHLTPREYGVKTWLALERREVTSNFNTMPADPKFREQMVETFFETFHDSVEFCNWPVEKISAHAEKNIDNYFKGVRGKPLPVSVMAFEPNGDLIGLALFLENKEEFAELDLLFVKPAYQRKGIATEMVTTAANTLYRAGVRELRCAYHVCNELSQAWQNKYGFTDIPEQFYCSMKYHWYRYEILRRKERGITDDLEELESKRDYWYAQMDDVWKH